ncbi:MAG: InlB B-repeat-containing protein, partial [Wujia sp.]
TYNITYDLDGGTNAAGNPLTYTYGIGVAQFLDAIKTGYTFGGWFDAGFTTQITSITTGQVGAVSLYAKFTADTYTITYHNVDGATNTNPAAYTYDIGVTSFADASKTGYTFGGWYSDAALTTAVTSISATQTGAVDLYAKFTPITYNITYDLDGGTNAAGNPSAYTYGTGVPSLADASKSGYTFGGWYSDAALTTKVTSISATQTGNVKLYAKFTFKKLKGEGSISVADVYYGKTPEAVATSSTNGTSAVTLQYKQKNASDATYTSTRPTKVGEYTARATFAETEVYEKLVVTDDFAIHYLNAPESPYNLDGTKGENGYYKSSVTIYPASGYLIADSLDGNYKEKLEITKSTNSFSTYLKKISTGEKTAGIAVPEIKIDTATPNIKNASSGDTLYGDEAEIIIEDDNLRQVFVNGEPVEFENGKAVLKLSSNQGEENYEIIGVDDAGNKKTIHVVVAADWMKTRQIPAGVKVKLFSKYSYTLGSGTWTVSGDGTTYSGNISFYVNSDGEYSFSN